jgi:hypothetical protein
VKVLGIIIIPVCNVELHLIGMTTIRPRKIPKIMSDEKKSLVTPTSNYQRHPPPPAYRPTRSLHIAISLLILVGFVFYAQRNIPKQAPLSRPYTVGGKELPERYAICSKEGKKVYTVPEQGGVGGVECVVVGGKEVVDTGSLGMYRSHADMTSLTRLAKIRRKWVDATTIESPLEIRQAGGIKIIYLPPGHTLTPVS